MSFIGVTIFSVRPGRMPDFQARFAAALRERSAAPLASFTVGIGVVNTLVCIDAPASPEMLTTLASEASAFARREHDVLRGVTTDICREVAGGAPLASLAGARFVLFDTFDPSRCDLPEAAAPGVHLDVTAGRAGLRLRFTPFATPDSAVAAARDGRRAGEGSSNALLVAEH